MLNAAHEDCKGLGAVPMLAYVPARNCHQI
jgi:hypothetical protein